MRLEWPCCKYLFLHVFFFLFSVSQLGHKKSQGTALNLIVQIFFPNFLLADADELKDRSARVNFFFFNLRLWELP